MLYCCECVDCDLVGQVLGWGVLLPSVPGAFGFLREVQQKTVLLGMSWVLFGVPQALVHIGRGLGEGLVVETHRKVLSRLCFCLSFLAIRSTFTPGNEVCCSE